VGFGYLNEDKEVFQRGLGLDRAQVDRMYDAPPWLKDPEEPLVKLSSLLKDASFSQTLADTDDIELGEARAELRRLMTLMEGFGRATNDRFGRGAFGMALIGVGQRFMRIEDYARQCLMWIRIRRSTDMRLGMAQILDVAPIADKFARTARAMEALATEIPAFQPLITPRRMMATARSKASREKQLEDLRKIAAENKPAIDAFLDRHPEFLISD
jgi:hypothetical protein